MLLFFTALYLLINVVIGFIAARRVQNSTDFMLAGRKLGLMVAGTSIFATWFGSETIMSSSVEFTEGGLLAVIKDPFGAALCLLLIGLFFVRPLYRLNIITLSDYFRLRFNRSAESLSGILQAFSYLSWIAAQMQAMGILLTVISKGTIFELALAEAILLGACLVCIYTLVGGMWAVSITDFVQTIVILGGLIILTVLLTQQAGGISNIIAKQEPDFFRFIPKANTHDWLQYMVAWMVVGLGSIPSQDVFQRTMSAKNERTAILSAYLASFLYLSIALLPLIIGLCGKILYPELLLDADKKEMFLPNIVLNHSPIWVQIIFFGALISAIMSTTSGAILSPATIIAENLVKPFFPSISDRKLLLVLRLSILGTALASFYMATGGKSIYELAADSSELALVAIFVPMAMGIYWKRSNWQGAMASMLGGLLSWFFYGLFFPEASFPAMFIGLIISFLLMVSVSLYFPLQRDNDQ